MCARSWAATLESSGTIQFVRTRSFIVALRIETNQTSVSKHCANTEDAFKSQNLVLRSNQCPSQQYLVNGFCLRVANFDVHCTHQ